MDTAVPSESASVVATKEASIGDISLNVPVDATVVAPIMSTTQPRLSCSYEQDGYTYKFSVLLTTTNLGDYDGVNNLSQTFYSTTTAFGALKDLVIVEQGPIQVGDVSGALFIYTYMHANPEVEAVSKNIAFSYKGQTYWVTSSILEADAIDATLDAIFDSIVLH
ncbi:MAG: hypothetical protein ACOX3W_01200 [Christensenellaceae bacterium]|jgi:hypothetical protein